jgi:hypothetical protein
MHRFLPSAHERADDLRRTLAAFDGSSLVRPDGHETVVATFAKLSKQCGLLEERQGDDITALLLSRHFVVPSAASGLPNVSAVPQLLSTRLDREQEEEALRRDALVMDAPASSAQALEQHNATVRAAHAHLAAAALSLDLPGAEAVARSGPAASLRAAGSLAAAPAGASNRAVGVSSNASASAATSPASTAASQAVASLLVSALRTGTGLDYVPPTADEALPVDDAPSRKRPRSAQGM